MKKFFGDKLAIFLFAFPALILFTVFVVYPLFPEVIISLQNHNGFRSLGFVGLANYVELLKSDTFWRENGNTFYFVALNVFVGLPISLLLAFFVDLQTPKIRRIFKFTAVLPAMISITVIAQMWLAIYEPNWGLLNSTLKAIGLGGFEREWLTDKHTVMPSIAVVFIWQFIGINSLLFYAGIKSIPKNYYEAALIDGAGFFRVSWNITIPLLQDVIKFVLIVSTLGSMAMYAHIAILSGGGPGITSRTIVYEMNYLAFTTSEFGKGTSVAILFIIECLIVSFLINKFFARKKIQF